MSQRLLRLKETSPFDWDQLVKRIDPPQLLEGTLGAFVGRELILGMDEETVLDARTVVSRPARVDRILEGNPFLAGMTHGLVVNGKFNQQLTKELAHRRPSEAYALGVFAGATALDVYLERSVTGLRAAAQNAVYRTGQAIRKEEDVAGYVKPDRPRLLAMAVRARAEEDGYRAELADNALSAMVEQSLADGTASRHFREFLGQRSKGTGQTEGESASSRMFRTHTLHTQPELSINPEDASPFVRAITDAFPARISDMPPHELYEQGVRRSLAFVALAAGE
jgi:hypothetical protein